MIVGIGVDLVKINRFELLIDKWQEKIIKRIFTNEEHLYCSRHKKPPQHYAATFAVKEAVIKAYGKGDVKFKEIEILRQDTGKPIICLYGDTKKKINYMGVDNIHISITHDGDYSIAVAILENKK